MDIPMLEFDHRYAILENYNVRFVCLFKSKLYVTTASSPTLTDFVPFSMEMEGMPGRSFADFWNLMPIKVLKCLIAAAVYLPSEGPRKDLHTKTFFYGEKIKLCYILIEN